MGQNSASSQVLQHPHSNKTQRGEKEGERQRQRVCQKSNPTQPDPMGNGYACRSFHCKHRPIASSGLHLVSLPALLSTLPHSLHVLDFSLQLLGTNSPIYLFSFSHSTNRVIKVSIAYRSLSDCSLGHTLLLSAIPLLSHPPSALSLSMSWYVLSPP